MTLLAIQPPIETLTELVEYMDVYPNYYQSIPTKVKTNISSDAEAVLRIGAFAQQHGYLGLKKLETLIDFENCESRVLDMWAGYHNIPVPSFPSRSHIRTHVITVLADNTAINQEYTHLLGTPAYTWAIQAQGESGIYQLSPTAVAQVICEPNRFAFTNGDQLWISRILFMYHKDYDLAKRLICKNAMSINDLRYSKIGLIFYLRLLLNNNCIVTVDDLAEPPVTFEFLNWTGSAGNFDQAALFSMALGADAPELLKGDIYAVPLTINITADLQADIKEFLEDAVLNYFIPFSRMNANSVTINFTDYSNMW